MTGTSHHTKTADSIGTIAAVALLAYLSADFSHHVLGHGAACLALGGQIKSLTSVFVICSMTGAIVDLAGPLANVIVGVAALQFVSSRHLKSASLKLFFTLVAAFNLFWFALQMLFSAATRTDDWAWPLHQYRVPELGRYGLIVIGAVMYIIVFRSIASHIAIFARPVRRASLLVIIAWLTSGAIAVATAAFDPNAVSAILHHALPQSLLLAVGLLFLPARASSFSANVEPANTLICSASWASVALVAGLASIFFLGPGFPVGF